MQPVSAEYLTAITNPERQIATQVIISFADNETLTGVVSASGDEAETLVGVDNTINSIVTVPHRMAFADPYDETDSEDRARVYPSDDLYPTTEEAGWWGDTNSDEDGEISGGEELTLEYSTSTEVRSVSFWADSYLGYPVDFQVHYWNGSSWVSITSVTDNDQTNWSYELASAIDTTKIRITITKMSHAKDPARLLEFQGAFSADVTDRVQYWEILSEREQQGSVPVGNVSTAQLTLELDNTDGVFFRDSGSSYAAFMTANRKIQVYAGVVLDDGSEELLPQGEFFTNTWSTKGSDAVVRIKAWDKSKKMKELDFSSSSVYTGKRIDELVETLVDDFGLGEDDYEISTTTGTIDYAWFDNASYWSCLSDLTIGEGGSLYFDEYGKLLFEDRSFLAGITSSVATLTDLNTIEDMSEAWEQDRLKNRIVIPVKPLTAATSAQVYNLTETITVPAGGTKTLTVFFQQSPVINVGTPSVTGGANISIDTWTAYAWGGSLKLANAGASDETVTQITIDGQVLEELGGLRAIETDSTSISQNGTRTYELPAGGSRYVQSLSTAETMAEDLLDAMADPSSVYTMSGRGRPELQLADRVTIQHSGMSIDSEFYITRMVKKYDGGLMCEYTVLEAA